MVARWCIRVEGIALNFTFLSAEFYYQKNDTLMAA